LASSIWLRTQNATVFFSSQTNSCLFDSCFFFRVCKSSQCSSIS